MSESTRTRLRLCGQPGYTDTAAANDIHAVLTATGHPSGDRELLGDIAAIIARTGRPMVPGRHIEATVTESRTGWPTVEINAEATCVVVRQDPSGSGLLIEITTRTPAERDQLIVTLDGRCLHHPCPPGDHSA